MRFLKLSLAAHIATGFAFILAFQLYFGYSATIIVLHSLLLFVGITLALLPCLYLQHKKAHRGTRIYLLAVLPILDLILLTIYFSTVMSNLIWSGNITMQLALSYIVDLGVMRETLPALNILLIFLPVTYLLLITTYQFLLQHHYDEDNTGEQAQIKLTTYSALGFIATGLLLQISFDREDPGIWDGEPISNLFLDYIPMFEFDETLPELEILDTESRSTSSRESSAQQRNVVLIMVDALRADHLMAYGYHRDTSPFLNGLRAAGELITVRSVHSSCSESACGILSVLSGKEFADIRSNTPHIGNILKGHGYTSSFIVTGNHAWGGLRTMYDADYLSDGESREDYSVNDDAGIIADLEKLDLDTSKPNFLYFHLYSAHELGLRHRQFNEYLPLQTSFNPIASLFADEEDLLLQKINNYDNGVLQADFFIAQIFAELERQGILENSVIYITSDHGQAFGEHGHHGHTRFLYEEHTSIPLFIFDPIAENYQNTEYATHIDIAPTILDSLGIEADMPGISLLQPAPETRVTRHQSTIVDGWKLNLVKLGDMAYKHLWEGIDYGERKNEMLFDISNDPLEQNNLIESTEAREIVRLAVEGL
jgi:glucan phosphoethanolaminetransferase (alkaline phosphatase superfamily)